MSMVYDKKVYAFAPGLRCSLSPQVVGEELERIGVALGSRDAPKAVTKAVVDAARPEDAPLHPCFEWDDSVGGELYRRNQAMKLISRTTYVLVARDGSDPPGPPQEPIRAWVHVKPAESGPCYMDTRVVMNDADLRAKVLAEAMKMLRSFQKRYSQLLELKDVFAAIDRLAADIEGDEAKDGD